MTTRKLFAMTGVARDCPHGSLGLLFCMLVLGCASGDAESTSSRCGAKAEGATAAIVNGRETNAYPAVGLMTAAGGSSCTATLVAPRTVLLAAHCVSGESGFEFHLGRSDAEIERSVRAARAVSHPQYQDDGLDHDLAYLVLAEPITDVTPVQISFAQPQVGWSVTLVGYGITGTDGEGGGIKREASTVITEVGGELATLWRFDHVAGQGVCNGDSGGPALRPIAGGYETVGVTSLADDNCSEYGYYARFDIDRAFLEQALFDGDGVPTQPGGPPVGPPMSSLCTDTCEYAFDGECDDGGPSAAFAECALGTDCGDCGPRMGGTESPSGPPAPPPSSEPPPGETPGGGQPPPSPEPSPEPGPETSPDPGTGSTPAPGASATCNDTCPFARDGECDDGGPGALCVFCPLGTDCSDCGAR